MLGSCFSERLSGNENFELFEYDRDLDITDYSVLRAVFQRISPDFVINCAAYTDVDGAETNRELAFKVNGEACKNIAKACKGISAILIHFSTDYVFDGRKKDGCRDSYCESDSPNPINVYGESKLLGEKMIIETMADVYIIRTSWLFGPNGKNFVDTMLKLATERDQLSVVGDQVGSPTYTKDLCEAVVRFFFKKPAFGIYHLTNSGACSWHEFAKKIFEIKNIDVKVNKITSEEFPRPAKRPSCSILKNTKIMSLRPWEEALKAYLESF